MGTLKEVDHILDVSIPIPKDRYIAQAQDASVVSEVAANLASHLATEADSEPLSSRVNRCLSLGWFSATDPTSGQIYWCHESDPVRTATWNKPSDESARL